MASSALLQEGWRGANALISMTMMRLAMRGGAVGWGSSRLMSYPHGGRQSDGHY